MSYIDELRSLSGAELESAIESKISDTAHYLMNANSVASEIASSNANGWGLDVFEILEIWFEDETALARISYQLNGHQNQDQPWCGTEINGEAMAVIDLDGDVCYTKVTAARDLDMDGHQGVSDDAEEIYHNVAEPVLFTDITDEIKAYLGRHPEKLYELNPRKFEELISEILKDFGFDTELTRATRDGGRDIYAYVKNAVTSFVMFVECKRWLPPNNVGIDIVQRVHGAAQAGRAHKGMVVTTSFFTRPALEEQKKVSTVLELKDYEALKEWLGKYNDIPLIGE